MTCTQVHDWLPDLAAGELGRREQALCEAHLSGCSDCRQRLGGLREALDFLRRAGEGAAPPPDFRQRLHLRLAQEPAPALQVPLWQRLWERLLPQSPRAGVWGAALAGAAVMLLLVGGVRWAGRGGLVSQQVVQQVAVGPAPVQVPARRVAVVDLAFVTDQVIDGVQFEVTLPNELAFIEDGKAIAERTLRWSGTLAPGDEPIRLPVSGAQPGRYRIVARALGQGVNLEHEIWLQVVRS